MMKLASARRSFALSAAALGLLCSATAYGSTVTGTVIDAVAGIRLPSVIVRAYGANGEDPGLLATTGSDGRYSLGLPPGDYRIVAYDPTGVYATSFAGDADSFETSAVLKATADVSNYNFALKPGGRVTGRVVAGAAPLRDAFIAVYNLSGTRRGFTLTDEAGDYSIVLPPGSYKLVAFDNNRLYAPTFYPFATSFSAAGVVSVAAERTTQAIDFVLPRAGRLTGFVVDVSTNAAVRGMFIEAYNQSGERIASQQMTTDTFDLAVPAGAYRLVIADLAHVYAPAFYGDAPSFEESTEVAVGAGELRGGLRFAVVQAGHISGRAESNRTPLKSITVAVYNLDGTLRTSGKTEASGSYSLDLAPGPYKIVSWDDELVYAPQFYKLADAFRTSTIVSVVAGATVPIDFEMQRSGIIAGKVQDASSKAFLDSIMVSAYTAFGDVFTSTKSDSSGEYRLVVAPGAYRVSASDESLHYATAYVGANAFEPSAETAVAAGTTVTVGFQMKQGILVTGSVTDSVQRSISGVEIAALDLNGNRVATARSKNGAFAFALLPGTYKFLAEDPKHRYTFTFYSGSKTLSGATPVSISSATPPAAVTFVLSPEPRRRATSH